MKISESILNKKTSKFLDYIHIDKRFKKHHEELEEAQQTKNGNDQGENNPEVAYIRPAS